MKRGVRLFVASVTAGALVASAVTAEAAVHWLITSPKQVKPGTLTLNDLSKGARQTLQGAHGPKGATGAPGPKGDPGTPGTVGPGSVHTMYATVPEGQSTTLISLPTIGEIDATCTTTGTAPFIKTTITYNNTTGQSVWLLTLPAGVPPTALTLTPGQTLGTDLTGNSQGVLFLHVRYGASAASSHVGTADVWVYQAHNQGCYVSGVVNSNDLG